MSNEILEVCGIYGLRCITTGKWYIGQSLDIHERWKKEKAIQRTAQKKFISFYKERLEKKKKLFITI